MLSLHKGDEERYFECVEMFFCYMVVLENNFFTSYIPLKENVVLLFYQPVLYPGRSFCNILTVLQQLEYKGMLQCRSFAGCFFTCYIICSVDASVFSCMFMSWILWCCHLSLLETWKSGFECKLPEI